MGCEMGRKRTIGILIRNAVRDKAKSVLEISKEIEAKTGRRPKANTVRVVLNQAAAKGEIQITRFYVGHSARGIRAISHDEGIEDRLDALIFGWCGKSKHE